MPKLLMGIWSTPQSHEHLVSHGHPPSWEWCVSESSKRACRRTEKAPMHQEEPTCPCCLPALGDSVSYSHMGGWRRV